MAWTALSRRERARRGERRARGERTRIAGQGELVRERARPAGEPMSADGRGLVPRREGRHLLIVGATGSGKTVSARRWLLARILADGVAVLATDPKGDRGLERDLCAPARLVGRPFVVFDPRGPASDRWNPL
jgi:DNA helicase HerA-like ATPase